MSRPPSFRLVLFFFIVFVAVCVIEARIAWGDVRPPRRDSVAWSLPWPWVAVGAGVLAGTVVGFLRARRRHKRRAVFLPLTLAALALSTASLARPPSSPAVRPTTGL